MARAIKQHDLQSIQADIAVAELTLNAYQNTHPDNRDLLCQAAYHLGQAAEKCLKGIIRADRRDIWNDVSDTHDITKLMQKAEICRSGIIKNHPYIAENSDRMAKFNNLRYGLRSITVTEIKQLMTAVKSFEQELEQDFMKAHPDAEQNKADSRHEWESRPKTELQLPVPPSKKQHKTKIEQEVEAQKEREKERNNASYGRSGKPYGKGGKKPYRKQNGSYSKNHGRPKSKQQGKD